MSESSDPRAEIEELAFECLDRMREDGAAALDRVCAEHPERADAVRGVLARLRAAGLVDEAPTDTEPGREFGEYRLLRRLGSGGMGIVWLAEQPSMNRRVALKLMRAGAYQSERTRERFRREALAISGLQHPGICTVFAVGDVDDTPYIAMRYVPGETLEARLERAREEVGSAGSGGSRSACPTTHAEIDGVLALIEKIARTIHVAHEAGIVHRDLKPSNVMIGPEGEPVVLDFGLAKAAEFADQATLTGSGDLLGTPAYMAPEQVRPSRRDVDRRTDVYALGVMLFESLTSERPFAGLTRADLFERIVRDPTPNARRINRHLPPDVSAVLGRAMEKIPAKRYATAAELADELGRIRKREPVLARRIGPLGRTSRWAQRNPLAAMLLVTMLGGMVAVSWQWLRAEENRRMADKALAEFDLVRNVVGLRRAEQAESAMYPAWPSNLPDIDAWLSEHAAPLLEALPDLERALRDIESRAIRWTPDELAAMQESHPRAGELTRLRDELEARRRAQAVRDGEAAAPHPADLDEGAWSDDLAELQPIVWEMVSPLRGSFGREGLGLALARKQLALARNGRHEARVLLNVACGLFAVGLDDEARRAIADARAAVSEHQRAGLERMLLELESHLAFASTDEARSELDLLEDKVRELEDEIQLACVRFEDEADTFLHGTLREAVNGIERFATTALLAVQRRRSWAARVEEMTIDRYRDRWERARSSILESELYAAPALDLPPQMGLIPIGPNPVTGLWEFYHLRSAWDPRSDIDPAEIVIPEHGADGSVSVEGRGIVFVLIPGGEFVMGAQARDPRGPNYDAGAQPKEGPPGLVALAPYFLAKHELTQGQWARLTAGEYPSWWKLGTAYDELDAQPVIDSNPVELVSWTECDRLLTRFGLALPTEAQWEYGCRAGTDSPWFTGDAPESLEGHANVQDQTSAGQLPDWGPAESFTDGYKIPAPVGSFAPNGFGLHDTAGNVAEWCADTANPYELSEARPGDGLRVAARDSRSERVSRGGSYPYLGTYARSAYRDVNPDTHRDGDLGVRAARSLQLRSW